MNPLDPRSTWGPREARHLLNRAGFGLPRTRVYELAALSPGEAVAALMDTATPDAFPEPDFLPPYVRPAELYRGLDSIGVHEQRAIKSDKRQEERAAVEQLKAWWLMRMRLSPQPLREKMTLFWHGHFATSAQKVQLAEANYRLNRLFREQATGNFKTLTAHVGQSAAMLEYLDNQRSTKAHPNENWARELMELFTLGQGQYTEEDIKASARAFTGWAMNPDGEFEFRLDAHDADQKTFMGQSGRLDGWDVLDIIFQQPAASTFLTAKLWRYFTGTEPSPEVLAGLAATFRDGGYEVAPLLHQMFLSEAFYAPEVIGAQVKSPAQFVVQLSDDLALAQPPYPVMAQACRALGQDLFYPPNVKGWDGNLAWINANALLHRYNLPGKIALAGRAMAALHDQIDVPGDEPTGAMDAMEAPAMMKSGDDEPKNALNVMQKQYRKQLQAALPAALEGLPREEQKAARITLRDGAPQDRVALLQRLGLPMPPELQATAPALFDALTTETAGACIDALVAYYLVTSITPAQRDTLLQALGARDADMPLRPADVSDAQRAAVMHLLTSTAEYQLC